ncbi:MAG TPA: DUF4143 domain-containing protein [Bacilli bacterium]|nr:DUF4143 domain-containing protein [Bacilli bacterium]HPK68181.1 DUF4143 domain-containing protein [Bacilli bacterium]
MIYKQRIMDQVLEYRLSSKGAVLITGPKWCGKTTTAKRHAGSFLNMQDPISKQQYLALAKINPLELLKGGTPRLIDEWQISPNIWDAVRQEVDRRGEFGQFILTGSSVPAKMDASSHSGIGRIVAVKMRPMSLFESSESNGEISLSDLFNNPKYGKTSESNLSIEDLAFLVCRGGWPLAALSKGNIALQQAIDYHEAIISQDIRMVDDVKRSPIKAASLLKSYARHISTRTATTSLLSDVNQGEQATIFSIETLNDYLEAFKKLFVIEELESWNPNFRSKATARVSPTRHFVDPSIATSALNMSPQDLINDIKTFGLLFESLCIRDLRVYSDVLKGKVYHYRDNTNLEIDAIIHLDNGKWGAIEVKLGDYEIPKAVNNLQKLKDKINTEKMNEPSFLMVLTGTKYAYKDESGVWIVPIGCLAY